MHLIIGGVYQGKTAYAKALYGISDSDFYTCCGAVIPQDTRALCHLERFTRACVEAGKNPAAVWEALGAAPELILCDDMFCGVVPLDATERLWREETGRLLAALGARADRVTRVFCGLPLELKQAKR